MAQHTKVCRKCNITRPNRCFSEHRRVCKPCMVATAKAHREANLDKSREHNRRYAARGRLFLLEYLTKHPCIQCGEDNPILLDFDHLDPATKSFSVSNRTTVHPRLLEKEIAKCQILCVRCHRLKNADQLNWYQEENIRKLLAPWLS